MIEVQKYFKDWSEKLSISEDDIKKEYDTVLVEEKEIHSDMTPEEQQQTAIQRLAMAYKRQLRSPAVAFEGMILAVGDAIDIVAKLRREAKALFVEDQVRAIDTGVTDENGTPLDTRATWSTGKQNFGFGKPLPEKNILRSVYGIAVKKGEESPKFFTMNLNGLAAENEDIPIFKTVAFRAIDKTQDIDKQLRLNSSTFTKFEKIEKELPSVEDLITNYCEDITVPLSELNTYHEATADDYNRLVVTIADVEMLNLEPNAATGNRIMVIDDINMGESIDLEKQGTTCWLPKRLDIDFAEGSKVVVIGRTAQGKKRDENGNKTEELGDVMINTFGLYALPKHKIKVEVKEITKEDVVSEESEPEKTEKPVETKAW